MKMQSSYKGPRIEKYQEIKVRNEITSDLRPTEMDADISSLN